MSSLTLNGIPVILVCVLSFGVTLSVLDILLVKVFGKGISNLILFLRDRIFSAADHVKVVASKDKFDVETDCFAHEAISMVLGNGPDYDEINKKVLERVEELRAEKEDI